MPAETPSPGLSSAMISADERKWLHDKYERLAAEEGQLATSRTSYYAAIGSVLVTGVVVALADFGGNRLVLSAVVTFLAALGLLISFVWAVLLHRTNDARGLWREAARRLEDAQPPLDGTLNAEITLRSRETVTVNLLRPFHVHEERFADTHAISWMDRLNPERLTEILPVAFVVLWGAVLVVAWLAYL